MDLNLTAEQTTELADAAAALIAAEQARCECPPRQRGAATRKINAATENLDQVMRGILADHIDAAGRPSLAGLIVLERLGRQMADDRSAKAELVAEEEEEDDDMNDVQRAHQWRDYTEEGTTMIEANTDTIASHMPIHKSIAVADKIVQYRKDIVELEAKRDGLLERKQLTEAVEVHRRVELAQQQLAGFQEAINLSGLWSLTQNMLDQIINN